MARFSRKTVYLLLAVIVLFSVAVRYPMVDHERNNDTYFASLLIYSIQDNDRAVWTFHPLSYFGYYPASYPAGNSFFLTTLSDLTGLGTSLTILLAGLLIGVMAALGVFCLSRQFNMTSSYSLLAAFLASAAPRFIDTSYWNGSARAPFVVLAIILIMVALRAGSTRMTGYYYLIPFLLVGCVALHHMAVLLILLAAAYLMGTSISYVSVKIGTRSGRRHFSRYAAGGIMLSSVVTLLVISTYFLGYFGKDVLSGYQQSSLFSIQPEVLSVFLNISVSYVNQIGFVLVIAVLGIPSVLRKKRISSELLFLISSIIVFIPLIASALYISILLAPFAAILAASWLSVAVEKRRRRTVFLVISLLVVSSVVLPLWSINRWNHSQELSGEMLPGDNQSFNDGIYLSQYRDQADAIANVDVTSRRLSGISGVNFLWTGVESALSGDATRIGIDENITWGHEKFPKNLYIWFDYERKPQLDYLIILFVMRGAEFSAGNGDDMANWGGYYLSHDRLIAVMDNRWMEDYVWIYGYLPAYLPSELLEAQWKNPLTREVYSLGSYMIYQSEKTSMFALEVPNKMP